MNPIQNEIDNIFYQKALEKISSFQNTQNTLTPKDISNLDIKSELQNLINENEVD